MDDFLVASTAADLIDERRLTMRLLDDVPNHSVAVTVDTVYALVTISDTVGGLGTDDAAFVDNAYDYHDSAWTDADEYSLRTPPLNRVQSTLESDIGPETASDFNDVLSSLSTARGDGDGLDEVTISLLVAAETAYSCTTSASGARMSGSRARRRSPAPRRNSKRWTSSTPRKYRSTWVARDSA